MPPFYWCLSHWKIRDVSKWHKGWGCSAGGQEKILHIKYIIKDIPNLKCQVSKGFPAERKIEIMLSLSVVFLLFSFSIPISWWSIGHKFHSLRLQWHYFSFSFFFLKADGLLVCFEFFCPFTHRLNWLIIISFKDCCDSRSQCFYCFLINIWLAWHVQWIQVLDLLLFFLFWDVKFWNLFGLIGVVNIFLILKNRRSL